VPAANWRGHPSAIRTDDGPKFTSKAFMRWSEKHNIKRVLIQIGRPMQKGCIEGFNGKFCAECLKEYGSEILPQAREVISAAVQDYNE
jgi:putative transposase